MIDNDDDYFEEEYLDNETELYVSFTARVVGNIHVFVGQS